MNNLFAVFILIQSCIFGICCGVAVINYEFKDSFFSKHTRNKSIFLCVTMFCFPISILIGMFLAIKMCFCKYDKN